MLGSVSLSANQQAYQSLNLQHTRGNYCGAGPRHGCSDGAAAVSQRGSVSTVSFTRTESFHARVNVYGPGSLAPVAAVQQPAAGAVKASDTILSFLEAQLLRDLADGATPEELQSRLQAGVEGFEKGFGEALAMLDGLPGMTDAIRGEIDQTRDLVLQGADDLKRRLIEGEESQAVADSWAANTGATDTGSAAAYPGNAVAVKNSFSFQLTTADGDRVNIKATSLRASIIEAHMASLEQFQGSSVESARDRLHLQIKGELDEAELRAINDLLGQVNDLASQFFSGDVEQAFHLAQQLGYDSEEISGFALRLRHTSVQRMNEAYGSVSGAANGHAQERLSPLGAYIEQLTSAIETAGSFREPLQLLESLASNFNADRNAGFLESLKLGLPAAHDEA